MEVTRAPRASYRAHDDTPRRRVRSTSVGCPPWMRLARTRPASRSRVRWLLTLFWRTSRAAASSQTQTGPSRSIRTIPPGSDPREARAPPPHRPRCGAGRLDPQVLEDGQFNWHLMSPLGCRSSWAGRGHDRRIQARWTASATRATAKIRDRVALLTRPAVNRAPSQAPITEAIEVTITIGQSTGRRGQVGRERGEGRHRHRHRVRRGGEASAVPDEGESRGRAAPRRRSTTRRDGDERDRNPASRTGMTGRIGAASGQGACPRQLAAFPAVGDGRASWFVLRTRCPVHHIRKCHIVERDKAGPIGHEIGLATHPMGRNDIPTCCEPAWPASARSTPVGRA